MSLNKKIFISGALTGHEAEAAKYFPAACVEVLKHFPLAEIFSPHSLMSTKFNYSQCMTICMARIKGWATDIVYIHNDYYSTSRGSKLEREAAKAMGLGEYAIEYGTLIELPKE